MLTRRELLTAVAHLATTAMLVSCAKPEERPAAAAGHSDLERLASVAYDILPYQELPPALYVKIAQQVLNLNDPDIAAGLATLRAQQPGAWRDIPEAKRLAVLSSVQDTPFFHVLRANTLQVLLRDPATFPIVGYGGPSIEYGGYLNRGFNDIAWLPAQKTRRERTQS